MTRTAIAALLALFLATDVAAAPDGAFVYRGTLSEADAPANGRYGLRISVFASAEATTPLAGPVTYEAVDIDDGAFALPLDLDLGDAQQAWVEVAVRGPGDGDFVPLDGRQAVEALAGGTCWELTGNAGTAPAGNFVGTSDGAPLRIRGGGGIGVNTATPEATTVMTVLGGSGNGGTLWMQSPKGPNVSHAHFGTNGDWFLRSATNTGKVVLQDTATTGQVAIGTAAPQPGVKLHLANGFAGVAADTAPIPTVRLESGAEATIEISASDNEPAGIRMRNGLGASADFKVSGSSLANSLVVLGVSRTQTSYEFDFSTIGLGINKVPDVNDLEVNGTASKDTAGSWLANSDARIKTDVETVRDALSTLGRLRLVSFRYTPEYLASHPGIADHAYLNVIAQEFAEVFPDWVQDSGEKTAAGESILQIDTYPITIVTAAAVQELHRELLARDELAARDAARIAALEARLARVERLLAATQRARGETP